MIALIKNALLKAEAELAAAEVEMRRAINSRNTKAQNRAETRLRTARTEILRLGRLV